MPFTFVYRSPYDNLTGRYVRRFDDDTILSWFRKHWHTNGRSEELLGQGVYGFESLFNKISDNQIPVPQTVDELNAVFEKNVYAEGFVGAARSVFEVFTDDDELDLQYFFVEDEFVDQNPNRTRFLIHEGSLPTEVTTVLSDADSAPCTWLYVHSPVQSADSQTWDRVVCPGVRVADDPKPVIEAYEKLKYAEAETFFSQLVQWKDSNSNAIASWPEMLKNWAEIGKDPSSEKAEIDDATRLICANHICQLHHHAETWKRRSELSKLFYQTIVFDDVWANMYPELAKSIDYYASDRSLLAK